jgi:hypothetical protein
VKILKNVKPISSEMLLKTVINEGSSDQPIILCGSPGCRKVQVCEENNIKYIEVFDIDYQETGNIIADAIRAKKDGEFLVFTTTCYELADFFLLEDAFFIDLEAEHYIEV